MKANINIIFIFCCTITFSSCWHSDLADTHRGGGEIAFFQFTDSTLVNKVLLEIDGRDRTVPKTTTILGEKISAFHYIREM